MDDTLPPPLNPPPPPIIMPPPSRPASGRGWKIFAVLLMIGLALSVASNFKHLVREVITPGRPVQKHEHLLQETTIENNGSDNKILVIDLSLQKTSGKPVIASMGTVAASGGYYVSAPCQWIVANELTITGSIGVIMHGYNYRGLMDKIGLRPETYKSGRFKDMLSGDRKEADVPAEEAQMIQNLIMETYGRFTNVVAQGRRDAQTRNKGKGQSLSPDWSKYIDGRVFSGKQALELGFVDETGNWDTAVKRARTLAGIKDANLIQYQQPFDIGSLFKLFGKTDVPAIKVDFGMNFPKLQAGQLYFITPTALH